eukprot:CAMPEP_0119410274 /NCGR_PEP_ID=MMETSP1335-20130426/3338_1 /TAXON_ID=259385 /ORGANISM="Chrysoculter rhomboideus, Strain RCC1486" /LENGTH=389 /DNA_ID=CAMNT_0007434773 /DNA_START=340 /DNA_END=1507 /DNA_ORIENTATION=+
MDHAWMTTVTNNSGRGVARSRAPRVNRACPGGVLFGSGGGIRAAACPPAPPEGAAERAAEADLAQLGDEDLKPRPAQHDGQGHQQPGRDEVGEVVGVDGRLCEERQERLVPLREDEGDGDEKDAHLDLHDLGRVRQLDARGVDRGLEDGDRLHVAQLALDQLPRLIDKDLHPAEGEAQRHLRLPPHVDERAREPRVAVRRVEQQAVLQPPHSELDQTERDGELWQLEQLELHAEGEGGHQDEREARHVHRQHGGEDGAHPDVELAVPQRVVPPEDLQVAVRPAAALAERRADRVRREAARERARQIQRAVPGCVQSEADQRVLREAVGREAAHRLDRRAREDGVRAEEERLVGGVERGLPRVVHHVLPMPEGVERRRVAEDLPCGDEGD